jgi:hypothetical protein
MRSSDLIWNRACEGGGEEPRIGDRALSNLLGAHGLAMNGGVLHAVECLTPPELTDAADGYRFFDLDSVAELLVRARKLLEADEDLELHEAALDKEYARLVPEDSFLVIRFERRLDAHPEDFGPL